MGGTHGDGLPSGRGRISPGPTHQIKNGLTAGHLQCHAAAVSFDSSIVPLNFGGSSSMPKLAE